MWEEGSIWDAFWNGYLCGEYAKVGREGGYTVQAGVAGNGTVLLLGIGGRRNRPQLDFKTRC